MNKQITLHLPAEITGYEGELTFLFQMMVQKLFINRHKGFAENMTFQAAIDLIEGETRELVLAVTKGEPQFAAIAEAVDVANGGILAALMLTRLTKPQYNGHKQVGK